MSENPPCASDCSPEHEQTPASHDSQDTENREQRPASVRLIVRIVKVLVFLLVVAWLAKTLSQSWRQIQQYEWRPQYGWLATSCALYAIGYLAAAFFWHVSLRQLGQRPRLSASLAAYYCGQLAKYVPGKALVVIVRAGMVADVGVRASIAAVCVFYETLVMMGSGAFIGAILALICWGKGQSYSWLALVVAVGAVIPLTPPVFKFAVRLLRIAKGDPEAENALGSLKWRTLFIGFGLMTCLWICFGLSLWAAIQGLGIAVDPILQTAAKYISVVALATSLGFVVVVSPGGLGIREAILSALLAPFLAVMLQSPENADVVIDVAALSAIISLLQRILSIIGETLCAGIFTAADAVLKRRIPAEGNDA